MQMLNPFHSLTDNNNYNQIYIAPYSWSVFNEIVAQMAK